jgi:DNA-binding SARP family transcriptional activator
VCTAGWDFRLLGPLEARYNGAGVTVGGVKQRSILAMLLLDVGHVVPVRTLAAGLWGADTSEANVATLQVHVGNLRRALSAVVPDGVSDSSPVLTRSPGYVLRVDSECVDIHRFRREVRAARERSVEPRRARELLVDALALWHGSPLSGLEDQPFAQAAIVHLEEERLRAVERRIKVELDLGIHDDLVGELTELTARHPLREQLCGYLMLALYRSGRQAEALAAYRRTREQLRDQLGLEPGPDLRQLEGDVLRQAASLGVDHRHLATSTRSSRTTAARRADDRFAPASLTWSGGVIVLGVKCTIGRRADNVVSIDDIEASRHHASIRAAADGFVLTDQLSTNGTFVNGSRVTERVLSDGDIIRIGSTDFTFNQAGNDAGSGG